MSERGIGALLVESGSSLEYFTGIRWRLSERTTAAVIPAHGEVLIVTPAFEEPSVRETLEVDGDVRPWNEARQSLRADRARAARTAACAPAPLAVEPTVRFFIVDGVRRASRGYEIVSGDPLIRACRMIKSPAELALMQAANNVTIEALRRVHARIERGMSAADIGALMNGATIALGGSPEFALVLLNEASAYPHGSLQTADGARGLDHPDGLRLHRAWLSVRYLAHLGVRRAHRPPAQGLEHRQARPGDRARNREARRPRRADR